MNIRTLFMLGDSSMEMMNGSWIVDLRFDISLNSISVIPGRWSGDDEKLCELTPFTIEKISA